MDWFLCDRGLRHERVKVWQFLYQFPEILMSLLEQKNMNKSKLSFRSGSPDLMCLNSIDKKGP